MGLRILANENVPGEAVETLRRAGHDVVWVRTAAPGSPDDVVLARAQAEDRAVMTFDKDFGELAFGPKDLGGRLLAVIESRSDWSGHFSVVHNDRIRMVALSPKEST